MSYNLEQKQNQECFLFEGAVGSNRLLSFRPPRVAIALMAAALGLHLLSPAGTILFLPFKWLGAISLAVGFGVMMWTWVLFTRGKTAICPTAMATSFIVRAPFSFSRNPMYLGMVMMLTGTAFLLGSVIAFAAPVAFLFIINDFFIPFEEQSMKQLFGEQYTDYQRRVRRWL
ncbi:MAG: methyltransferase family protein [Thermoleophilia bacterium]